MAQGNVPTKRTTSLSGSARLSLSVGKSAQNTSNTASGRHPLRQDWSISYVHRPPGAKVEYEKEIRKVATFGSIESFLHLYSHITPPNELPPVTDILVFVSRIGRPGVWEEMRDGGKFTIRLVHPITPLLFENLLLALIGDQFDESDNVVGCVLSVRQTEDILSVWVEEESDSVRSGALKEKILTLLSLPSTTSCEYRANRIFLEATSKPAFNNVNPINAINEHQNEHHSNNNNHHQQHPRQHHSHHNYIHDKHNVDRSDRGERGERPERERGERNHWSGTGGFRENRRNQPGGGVVGGEREKRESAWGS
ncbi:uncharacterized protein I206_100963 [Kwoniella pini CBS 10737]|uniref:Translation initiation factor 4E n=1 Tax=Kwoniella pini CBS 10737 TaxID=1296096 RepID=A0A1B9IBN5_9TREE|nr:uncharacterized protein I206_00363 [Kwoniella pini CBS 10737]OCF53062.1 hypothetical protein I206_00363 [Kwoniella pini CBS 10737]